MTDAKKSKKKSPVKKSFSGKSPSKRPTTRSGRILRGPLFWILVAIFGVSIFGQISSAGNRYTQIETSQALDAIARSSVESAEIVDKDQKIRLILKPVLRLRVQQRWRLHTLPAKNPQLSML